MNYINDFKIIIHELNNINDNNIYILREDLIPYSFGGNKVRKALNFLTEIKDGNYNCIITYGSKSSNHVRVIANLANDLKIQCHVITPVSEGDTFNNKISKILKVNFIECKLDNVKSTIDKTIENLRNAGLNPYFIEGGGHGNLGTKAYHNVFNEIVDFEGKHKIYFDYIFFASGTGTTQAGLIIGNKLLNQRKEIIGISIARNANKGIQVINESISNYINELNLDLNISIDDIKFNDEYIVNGYGSYNLEIKNTVINQYKNYGLPLDPTYTGKAFWGMNEYIRKNIIKDKNILFIHTGGLPLFFDFILKESN